VKYWMAGGVVTLLIAIFLSLGGRELLLGSSNSSAALATYTDEAFYQPEEKPLITSSIIPIPHLKPLEPELQAKVTLGQRLFNDVRLSGPESVSCMSCHHLPLGGHDVRGVSSGVSGKPIRRNTPTVYNAAFNFRQFWDGRAFDLFEQVSGPLLNRDEMGGEWALVISRLQSDPEMVELS
jgi:cytochrome c peroxidase